MTDLAGERWQDLASALVDTMYAMSSSEMLALDSRLRSLASPGGAETPHPIWPPVVEGRKAQSVHVLDSRGEGTYPCPRRHRRGCFCLGATGFAE
jgi:hypothetical protein